MRECQWHWQLDGIGIVGEISSGRMRIQLTVDLLTSLKRVFSLGKGEITMLSPLNYRFKKRKYVFQLEFFFFNFISPFVNLFTYIYIFWVTTPPTPCIPPQNRFCPLVLWFCWRTNKKDEKKNIPFLLVWDEASYTGRFLVMFHAYVFYDQIGSSLPDLFTTS
jgi:hypothetical protein